MVTIYLKGQEKMQWCMKCGRKFRAFVDRKYGEKNGHLFELLLVINKKGYGKS